MTAQDKTIGIALVSGGLDSLVSLGIALKECDEVACLHAAYGQRTMDRERAAFLDICAHYGIAEKMIIDLGHIAEFGGSSLTDANADIPEGPIFSGIPSTYVPFRNANILAAGVSWAEAKGAGAVYIGIVEEDSSGYPDCKRTFIQKFQRLVEEGTRPDTDIMIRVPIISIKKDAIVRLGQGLETPFELSWSCYKNTGDTACGACESCLLRLRGFYRAGVEDPLKYEKFTDEAKKFIER